VGVTDGVGEGVIVSSGVLVGMEVAGRLEGSAERVAVGNTDASRSGESLEEQPIKSSRMHPAQKESTILFIISQKNNIKKNVVCPPNVLLQIR